MMRIFVLLAMVLALGSCGLVKSVGKGTGKLVGKGASALASRAFAGPAPVGGGLCGDRMLVGEEVGSVPGRIPGCGFDGAVRLRQVGDVTLSQSALMDCATAKALRTWVEDGVKPAIGRKGGGLSELRVAAHYVCRTRNHQPGAKISEHGKGRAIDISGFVLEDGTTITVEDGWQQRKTRKMLRDMHGAACGPFGTVLGPEADRFHKDHFHFDTASYRSGSYCR